MKHYKAVIFDLDGTLLNTLQDLTDSVNYALSQKSYPLHTVEEVRMMVGNGVRTLMERAVSYTFSSDQSPQASRDVPLKISNREFEEIFSLFKEHYAIHCNDTTAPYPGIKNLLDTLKKQGYSLAIVSNKIDSAVKTLRDLYFRDTIFVAIGEKEGIRKKPAPDTVIAALEELHVSAEDALYVGDSDVDIKTAQNAGMDCISVSWGFRDRDFLVANGAKTIIDTPAQLLDILSLF